MKLSDIKGEATLSVIADLVIPVANIASDKEASELFGRKPLPAGVTVSEFMIERAKKSIPALLKNHKSDVIDILSTLSLEGKEEYLASLTIPKLIVDVLDILTDDVFGQFFYSAQTNEHEEASGSAPENTEVVQPEDLSVMQ